jgi:hypothetical protein
MAVAISIRMSQNKRFEEVKKLIELKFYRVGDLCDLPLVAPDVWGEIGGNFNAEICNPNGLDLVDQGNGTWKFNQFPTP